MRPDYEVQIYDFNGDVKPVKLVTLMAWSCGIGTIPKILPIVKKFLGTPKGYPTDAIVDHIQTSYADVKEQLGL